MKAILTCLVAVLVTGVMSAQQSGSGFLATDSLSKASFGNERFCLPGLLNSSRSRGIEMAYNFINGGPIRTMDQLGNQPGQLRSLEGLIVKVKAPILLKPSLKLLAGFNYEPETYYFSTIPASNTFSIASPNFSDVFHDIDTRNLKSTTLSLYGLKSFDERHYLGFRLKAAYSGDYEGLIRFQDRYAGYSAMVFYGVKKNEDLEYGFGVVFNKNFRKTIALPGLLYNRNFSEKWGVEVLLPSYLNGRYNINNETILLFGTEFHSQSYSVDIENRFTGAQSLYHLSHTEARLGFSLERRIVPWVWMNIKGGYQLNLPTRFRTKVTGAQSYVVSPANAPYLRMGFFISPPDNLRKK